MDTNNLNQLIARYGLLVLVDGCKGTPPSWVEVP